MADRGALAVRLTRLISRGGAIPVSLFMAYANAHYYATRDPLGVGGDFITAPEISQMFGELIGLWCADMAMRAAPAAGFALAELGPGRGTLMADVLRAMARFGLTPPVHLIETSPVLRDLQAAVVAQARFHDDASTLPGGVPLLIIANEFFDALPIRQLVRVDAGWRERMVTIHDGQFAFCHGDVPMDAAVPDAWRPAPVGSMIETSPASSAVATDLCGAIARQGGAMLTIDYGYTQAGPGETLQAVSGHRPAGVLDAPGERDLTAHVDFSMLAGAARQAGLAVHGPTGQGAFLDRIGLDARTRSLSTAHPARAEALRGEYERLTAPDQMGALFKVLAMTSPDWPVPEGFAP